MRILGSILFVGILGLAACGGSQKGEETTPENPCTPAANPCNPDGTQPEGDPANPDKDKKQEGESNW